MKSTKHLISLVALLFASMNIAAQSLSSGTKWHWQEGTIVVDTPQRPAGQQHALGLAAPKLNTVRVGFVGLGARGPYAVSRFTYIPGVEIVALCDYELARAEACQEKLRQAGFPPAAVYGGPKAYEELCKRDDIDLVYVTTDWDHHFPVAKCALENGKHAAVEVPSVENLDQCWEIINLVERTRRHCMILENCCYDWYEMSALNMAQQGVFGEVIRAEGAYLHYLATGWDGYWKNPDGSDPEQLGWRLKYNRENRGDVYPTHGLGPVAQVMNIHRGDRFRTLVAVDTKAAMGNESMRRKTGRDCPDFRSGDHTTTIMRTENGHVIEIQHDVMTYLPYSRLYKLFGTEGYATKYPKQQFSLNANAIKRTGIPIVDPLENHEFMSEEQQGHLVAKYEHPILKKYGEMAKEVGGHGGMDFIMDARLVYCLQNGLPLDIDVYDLAEWCALAELGALSMDHNSASVAFPDFTRGYWNQQKGFKHAFASPEDEAATEAAAKASTKALKEMVVKKKLWEKYDKEKAKNAKKAAK